MIVKDAYLKMISARGSEDGSNGGLLSLLEWCGKMGLLEVTEEEAKRFWEDPAQPYVGPGPSSGGTQEP